MKKQEQLNRKIIPAYKIIEHINIPETEKFNLSNNIPLVTIKAGTQDIVKLVFEFEAGKWQEHEKNIPGLASATNHLIAEGTDKFSSEEIAEKLDFYGSYLFTTINKHFAHLSIYTLTKHLPGILPVVQDIIKNAIFPQHEFDIYIQNQKQNLQIALTKVENLAQRKFNNVLFGKNHPYGYTIQTDDFKTLKLDDLKNFHQQFYTLGNLKIIAGGKVTQEVIDLLDKYFGQDKNHTQKNYRQQNFLIESAPEKKHFIEKENAIQSALRIGKQIFNSPHPDYGKVKIANTVLGGYFSSRLMKNIREDKGYTYGIYSGIKETQHAGYFYISSEVGANVTTKALEQIYLEIKKLRTDLIPEKELKLVKNYLLGTQLKKFDGPFALIDSFLAVDNLGFDFDYYHKYIQTIKDITPAEIRELVNKYFHEDTLKEVVAGKMK